MPSIVAKLDLVALAACMVCMVVVVADGRWADVHWLWFTTSLLVGLTWAAMLYRAWPAPASAFEHGRPRLWRAGWATFMSFVAFGIAASVFVHVRDGPVDVMMMVGAGGALLASLRAAIPTTVGLAHPPQHNRAVAEDD